jgi:serine/threonine-protein kinase
MNRTVALKLLAPNLVQTPKARELFQREVRAAAKLNHANIVTAYDANQIEDRYFLVMEFVDGPNLDQLVRGQKPLPVPLVCEIIRQTANGLQYAHEMGMVHRDIKPANLLVQLAGPNQDLTVKILDFGLARLHEPGQENLPGGDRVIMGTPDFLSPEQATSLQDVDIRSDLYSLGCTFYFLLTGRVPFPKGTPLEKLERHKNEDPPPVEEIRPDVPAPVASIVRRLMAKYPPHRFQTPAELAEALVPFANAEAPALPNRPTIDLAGGSDQSLPDTSDLNADRPADGGAMVGTLPPDFTPTPSSHLSLAPLALPADEGRRWGSLVTALGMVITLAALIVLLVIILNG